MPTNNPPRQYASFQTYFADLPMSFKVLFVTASDELPAMIKGNLN